MEQNSNGNGELKKLKLVLSPLAKDEKKQSKESVGQKSREDLKARSALKLDRSEPRSESERETNKAKNKKKKKKGNFFGDLAKRVSTRLLKRESYSEEEIDKDNNNNNNNKKKEKKNEEENEKDINKKKEKKAEDFNLNKNNKNGINNKKGETPPTGVGEDLSESLRTKESIVKFVSVVQEIENTQTLKQYHTNMMTKYNNADANIISFNANKARNRSGAAACFEDSRVKLKVPGGKNDYINANWMKFEKLKKSYIATQHPLQYTIEDFWSMAFKEEVDVIIALTNLTIDEYPCYWPKVKDSYANYGSYFVSCKSVKKSKTKYSPVKYVLEVLPNGCSNSSLIELYHYPYWGRNLVPPNYKVLGQLVKKMRLKKSGGPIIVQCERGSNQSAVVIFVDVITTFLEENVNPNIENIIREIRSQRDGMLNDQLHFLYSFYSVLLLLKAKYMATKKENETVKTIEALEQKMIQYFGKSMSTEPHDTKVTSPTLEELLAQQ